MEWILHIVVAVILLIIAYIDSKTMEIPDPLNAALGMCGVVSCILNTGPNIKERLIGFFVISVPMYLLCLWIPEAFGGGDIKLTAVMGFYFGWKLVLVGTYFGILLGGIQAVYLMVRGKVRRGESVHMAFGPALCSGMILSMIFGEIVWNWYFG